MNGPEVPLDATKKSERFATYWSLSSKSLAMAIPSTQSIRLPEDSPSRVTGPLARSTPRLGHRLATSLPAICFLLRLLSSRLLALVYPALIFSASFAPKNFPSQQLLYGLARSIDRPPPTPASGTGKTNSGPGTFRILSRPLEPYSHQRVRSFSASLVYCCLISITLYK